MNCFTKALGASSAPAPVAPKPTGPAKAAPIPTPITPGKSPHGHLLGIDVSHHEPRLASWAKAKEFGVEWMYTKASEHGTYIDPSLAQHIGDAAAAGVLTGAYHFYRANVDGLEQAKLYLRATKGFRFDIPHIFDWESASPMSMSRQVQVDRAWMWLDVVRNESGRPPLIYGGQSFLKDLELDERFAAFQVLLAHYETTEDKVKAPAPWPDYWAWQFTDRDDVPGMAPGHRVDANWFNGSLADLRAFCGLPAEKAA